MKRFHAIKLPKALHKLSKKRRLCGDSVKFNYSLGQSVHWTVEKQRKCVACRQLKKKDIFTILNNAIIEVCVILEARSRKQCVVPVSNTKCHCHYRN